MASVNHGAEQLADLGRALKKQSGPELRKELLAGIRKEGKPAIADAREAALVILPSRGGLAGLVSKSSIGVRTRLSGTSASVTIKATGKAVKQIDRMDERGVVRHPVFGNRKSWSSQTIAKGWFTQPMERHAPKFRIAVVRVVDDVAKKIERSV